jgi:vancomycin resistance protein YoaR
MGTSVESRTPARPRFPGPRPSRDLLIRLGLGLLAVVVLAGLLLVGFRLARPGVLPNVELAGFEVGGMDSEALRSAVEGYRADRASATVTVVHPAPGGRAGVAEEAAVTATDPEIGYRFDAEATVDAVWALGRQVNPVAALADQLRATWSTIEVQPAEDIHAATLAAWAARTARALELEPIEGSLRFEGATVVRIDPEPGARVLEEPLRRDALDALLAGGPRELGARSEPVEPLTTTADVDAVYERALVAVSGPVRLFRNDGSVTLAPEEIGAVLAVERNVGADAAALRLVANPEALAAQIPDATITAFEGEPVDARFEVAGDAVRIIPSQDGFRFDGDKAADQLIAVAIVPEPREAELDGEVAAPALSTEDAEALGITERVSTFTTHFQAGQSRVRNIHRIADIVDGAMVRPGETFSLNEYVGPRTRERGFVEGGAIFEGEFVEEVGGGVSQFATTFFNAAYFGGYEFLTYKPHSYFISRYPAGREATISWPSVDLAIRNNSPHGILLKTAYSSTSITVSFYATKWVEVDSVSGEPHNHRQPETKERPNPGLPPGTRRVLQSGREGFDIVVTRILRFPGGREEQERFFTRYLAEPRIVEYGPAPQEEQPPPESGDEHDPPSEQDPPSEEEPSADD